MSRFGAPWTLAATCLLLAAGSSAAQSIDPLDTARSPRLRTDQVVRVGDGDLREDYFFEKVTGAAVLSPDAFVVLDRGSGEARTYDLAGTLKSKVGGAGKGPGEFVEALGLEALPGGRLMVWDGDLQRATVFGPDGMLQSTASPALGPMAIFFSGFVGGLSDGSWIQRLARNPMELRDEPEGPRRDMLVFRHVGSDGKLLERIAVLGPERVLVKYSQVSWEGVTPIFGRDLVSAMRGDTLLLALTDSLSVKRFTASGSPLPPLRLPRPTRPAGRQMAAAARAQLVAEAKAAGSASGGPLPGMTEYRRGKIESIEKLPAEATLPAFSDLLVGADGIVWVREFRIPGEPKAERWFSMGTDFRPTGWIEIPDEGRLVAAGYGLLVTVVKDEMDVESVVVLRLQ